MDEFTKSLKSISDAIDISSTFSNLANIKKPKTRLATNVGRQSPSGQQQPRKALDPAAAEEQRRGEAVLQQLDQGYFLQAFDPLEHELQQLADEAKQQDVDAIVEKLTGAVEVVSGRLKNHVLKNQDKLIQGITNVTSVDDDVKAAFVMVQACRQQLRMAADNVSSQIQVVGATRKKQRLMGALELASKVKKAKELHLQLKRYLEAGEFGEAILVCVECHQVLEGPLAGLAIEPQLRALVQRHYYDTLQRLDAALQHSCASFSPEGYSKLLEGYLLQGITPVVLAGKVLMAFKQAVHNGAVRVVRGTVLAAKAAAAPEVIAPSIASGGAGSLLLDGSFQQLCRQLPAKHLRPCMQQFLALAYDILGSYQLMAQFHDANQQAHITQQQQQQQEEAPGSEGPQAADQMAQVQEATRGLLKVVAGALRSGRPKVLDWVGAKVKEFLMAPSMARGDEVMQVFGWCEALMAVADVFADEPCHLRATLTSCYGALLDGYHRHNMDVLRSLLTNEQWGSIADSACSSTRSSIERAIRAGPFAAAEVEWGSLDLQGWLERGNPFTGGQAASLLPAVVGPSGAPADGGGSGGGGGSPGGNRVATQSSQRVMCWLRNYAALLAPLSEQRAQLYPQAWRYISELFDNYLLACFVLFSGVSLETLAWQDDCLPHRLRSALLRIMTNDGCKYKAAVEDLLENKPAAKPVLSGPVSSFLDFNLPTISLGGGGGGGGGGSFASAAAGGGSGSSSNPASKFDAFTKKFKETVVDLINTDLSQPYELQSPARQQQQQQASPQRAPQPQRPGTPAQASPGALPQQGQQQQAGGSGPPTPAAGAPGPGTPRAAAVAAAAAAAPILTATAAAAAAASASTSAGASTGGARTPRPPEPSETTAGPAPIIGAAPAASAAGTGGGAGAAAGGRWGLLERMVAIESLTGIAAELKAARGALAATLGGGGQQALGRDVELYCSRTVDAVQDLKEAIFRGATKQLLQGIFDPDRGTAAQIAAAGYSSREPASTYQPWADALLCHLGGFGRCVAESGLPGDIQKQMWDHAAKLVADAVLDGLARCKRCSVAGRAAMSLDLGFIEKGLRGLLPQGSSAASGLRPVDAYIKAFYVPWEELPRWSQVHLAEYGKAKILTLIEAMAEAYGVKRAQKSALLDKLNAELDEFA